MKFGFYKEFLFHKIYGRIEKSYLKKIRSQIQNTDFSIISNNCWGGSVYEDLGLGYRTPTVGLFFFAPCYINFLSDLKRNLTAPLQFVKRSKYDKGNYLQSLNPYPIGLIGGNIEIHFLHYHSEEEALEKWTKRADRVNHDNLFISFTDSEVCTIEEIRAFDQLPYRKVFFSAKKIDGIESLVFLRSYEGQDGVGNIYDERRKYRKDFDVAKWLNSK